MIDGFVQGFELLFTWPGPLLLITAIAIGMVVGILPGIGGAAGMALVLPATYTMSGSHAVMFLLALQVSSGIGAQLPTLLINVPGDAPHAAALLDGYPMTKQGRAAEALGAATLSSLIGAVLGTVFLIALIPVARELVLAFSYPEFFMVSVMGLAMIAALTKGATRKGLISAGIGFMLAFIGLDPAHGSPRFVFGQLYLWDGVQLVPLIIGLFAGSEMVALFSHRGGASIGPVEGKNRSRLRDGYLASIRDWKNNVVSSVIGFAIGIIPGIGGTVASFIAYGRAAQTSKNREQFGNGAVEGLNAVEAANDADQGGAILTTLAFGIPGGVPMAVLLAALTLHGFETGPAMMSGGDGSILYVIVIAILVPRLIAGGIVVGLAKPAIALTRVSGHIVAPLIVVIATVSVYSLRSQMLDVVAMVFFAFVGFVFERYGYSRVALVIAFILGPITEAAFHQTLIAFGWTGFFIRPISVVMMLILLVSLFGKPIARFVRRRRAEREQQLVS